MKNENIYTVKAIKIKTIFQFEEIDRIEEFLKSLDGMIDAKVSMEKSCVVVRFDEHSLAIKKIKDSIHQLGYETEDIQYIQPFSFRKQKKMSKEERRKKWIFYACLIGAVGAYLVINHFLGVNFLIGMSGSVSLGAILIMGVVSSLHCVGFCGGLAMYQCSRIRSDACCVKKDSFSLKPSIQYHTGRIAAYAVSGSMLGLLGSVVHIPYIIRAVFILLLSAILILSGVNLLKDYNWFLPKQEGKYFHMYQRIARISPFLSGACCALIPCAPLLTMEAYALSSGSILYGGLCGLLFGIGTLPLMFGLTSFSNWISAKIQRQWKWITGIMILLLGVMLLSRGLAFSGLSLGGNVIDSAQIQASITETGTAQIVKGDIANGDFLRLLHIPERQFSGLLKFQKER